MILAGIDEAGYGPVLGPLVVGCVAFKVTPAPPHDDSSSEPSTLADLPCLWKLLRRSLARTRSKTGRKLHVNDSKLVYNSGVGLKELERSVLTLVAAAGQLPLELAALLASLAPAVCEEMLRYPWYRAPADERFPLEQDATSIRLLANGLKAEMDRSGTTCVHVAARVVCEHELNRMMAATRNKGTTLFSITAMHLDELLKKFSAEGLTIICDRHGGRGHYGGLLRLMFEDWDLRIISEDQTCSEYELANRGRSVKIVFREKAEMACMSVAYASMVSKYLREAMMRRFNAYWLDLLPDLRPTAGYHNDGMRFLDEIEPLRRQFQIPDERLVRSR